MFNYSINCYHFFKILILIIQRYNTPGFFYIESAENPQEVLLIKKEENSKPYVIREF